MKTTLEIAKRELRILFSSPIGWIIVILFTVQLGSLLTSSLSSRVLRVWSFNEDLLSLTYNLLFSGSNSLISGMGTKLYLIIPLLTMGLFSREYSEGTIKLMFSSPLSTSEIILGKYLAMIIFTLLLMGIMGLFGLYLGLFVIENIDLYMLISGIFLLFLTICTYCSIGLFVSSLTSYQFVSAMGVVGIIFGLNYINSFAVEGVPNYIEFMLNWPRGISFIYTYKGFIGLWDVTYYLIFISAFIAFTFIRVSSLRVKRSILNQAKLYIIVIACMFLIGYISMYPMFEFYWHSRNPVLLDTKILISQNELPSIRSIFSQVIPTMLVIVASAYIITRRRS